MQLIEDNEDERHFFDKNLHGYHIIINSFYLKREDKAEKCICQLLNIKYNQYCSLKQCFVLKLLLHCTTF